MRLTFSASPGECSATDAALPVSSFAARSSSCLVLIFAICGKTTARIPFKPVSQDFLTTLAVDLPPSYHT